MGNYEFIITLEPTLKLKELDKKKKTFFTVSLSVQHQNSWDFNTLMVFNDNNDVASNNLNNGNENHKMIAIVTIENVYFIEIYILRM